MNLRGWLRSVQIFNAISSSFSSVAAELAELKHPCLEKRDIRHLKQIQIIIPWLTLVLAE